MFVNDFDDKLFIILVLLKEGRVLTVATCTQAETSDKFYRQETNILKFASFVLLLLSNFSYRVNRCIRHHIRPKQFNSCTQLAPHNNHTVRARRLREVSMRSRYKYSFAMFCRAQGTAQAWYRVDLNPGAPR